MIDVVIIGAGPAGLSAAIYAKRAGFSTIVIEKAAMSGGQLINTYEVDNYPGLRGLSGFEMAMSFREHAQELGTEFVEGEVTELRDEGEKKQVITKDAIYEARAVIIATGAVHAPLGVWGEKELTGKGVSYCAVCDGAFFKEKVTAVVGGGNTAVEDAIFLAQFCKKVYLIHRRDKLRAAEILQKKLFLLPNVEVLWDASVEKIVGTEQVEGVLIVNKKTGVETELPVNGVFVAVGIRPVSQNFAPLIHTDENGYLVAGEDGTTNIKGIFAAGDVRTKKLRQIVTAAADGACAVSSVQEYFLESTKSHKN